jgi:hypothetical protein
MQLSMLALLPLWGADRFGPYVAATGAFQWLTFLVLGVEKTGLTVLPRNKVLAPQLTRLLVGRAVAPTVLALAGTAVLLPIGGSWALYAGAAAYCAGQGTFSVLASLNRLDGHAGRESAAYLGYALWIVAMAGLAFAGLLQPYGYLVALVAGLLIGCVALAFGVPGLFRAPQRTRPGAVVRRMVDRRVFLLGLSDVASGAGVSVLYVVLALVGTPTDAATIYVVLVVSSVFGALGILVLRLLQPATSMRLRGTGGQSGRHQAATLSAWSALITGAMVVLGALVLLIALLTNGPAAAGALGTGRAALIITVAVEMSVFCLVSYTTFLLENTTGAALRLTSAASITGLVATTLAGLAAVPVLHAVGAVVALVLGLVARSVHMYVWLQRADRPPTPVALPVPAR